MTKHGLKSQAQNTFLLVALNAKYIHSNLGVLSIQAYAGKQGIKIDVAEYTINQRTEEILRDIYEREPDVLAFSCYIWNVKLLCDIAEQFHLLKPQVPIWIGGPEVSYEAEKTLHTHPWCKGILIGEGEAAVTELAKAYLEYGKSKETDGKYANNDFDAVLADIPGLLFRRRETVAADFRDKQADGSHTFTKEEYTDDIVKTTPGAVLSMDELPFVYQDMSLFAHKILYYESSRGCPFGCAYCLSSIDKGVRFRSMELVKSELQFFLEQKVPQVKFIDRTFNCNPERSIQIWTYIHEHDNGVTNFHFEIAADLLHEQEIACLQQLRPGLVQLEIGVQSANEDTIRAVNRQQNLRHLQQVIAQIRKGNNVHIHLDLIAGLPWEDFDSFKHSFDTVYEMEPNQLQLGFLKVLKGSPVHQKKDEYGIIYQPQAPYEVMRTKWLDFTDIIRLKRVEEMVEVYYNSGQFRLTMTYLGMLYENPFSLYDALGEYYHMKGLEQQSHSRQKRYEILLDFAEWLEKGAGSCRQQKCEIHLLKEFLLFDLYARENVKNRPRWAKEAVDKKLRRSFYDTQQNIERYLTDYQKYKPSQVANMTHLEMFDIDIEAFVYEKRLVYKKNLILFDYQKRDAIYHQARMIPALPLA